jgi:hypothetical protein
MKVIRHGTNCFMAIIENREEKAYLGQKRDQHQEWIPLFLASCSTPCAYMHTRTYQVQLCQDQHIETEQIVSLSNISPQREQK